MFRGDSASRTLAVSGLIAGVVIGSASMAAIQPEPPTIAPKRSVPPPPASPARPAQIIPPPGDGIGGPIGGRWGEGKFIVRRAGVLVPAPTGEWVFSFLPTASGPRERPVVLMPNAVLERLERALRISPDSMGDANEQDASSKPVVSLTGQVFLYAGREYLLASAFSIAAPTPAPADEAPSTLETPEADADAADGTGAETPASDSDAPTQRPESEQINAAVSDSAVEDLIKDLEARRGPTVRRSISASTPAPLAPEPASSATASSAVSPDAATSEAGAAAPDGDGRLLTGMRGRVVRLAGGELAFAADNDQNSRSRGPLVLLPCRTLTRLEELAQARGDDQAIELSGRVTSYQGRQFVLPTSYLIPAPSELRPAQ